MSLKVADSEHEMKKLLVFAVIFSFNAADAGIFSSIKNKVSSVSGKVATILDQRGAKRTAGTSATNSTIIADPTSQSELTTILNSMYEEAKKVRKKNLLKPKIAYYASNLCIALQKCISAPTTTSTNISSIENYIQNLQGKGVDVTGLNQYLASLKTSVAKFNSSVVSISDRSINITVQQEIISILNEMNFATVQIYNSRLTDMIVVKNATLLQKKLQDCSINPTTVSDSLGTIAEYIQNLQAQNVDVTFLNQKLAILKEKAGTLINSGISVDISKVDSAVLSGFLTALNNIQQEILRIQNSYQANSVLVNYSGQIYNVLLGCSQNFVITSNHISAVSQYIQWLSTQQIDVTNLNQKLTVLNEKATQFNNAVASVNAVTNVPVVNTETVVPAGAIDNSANLTGM